jgi:hypothetical protein
LTGSRRTRPTGRGRRGTHRYGSHENAGKIAYCKTCNRPFEKWLKPRTILIYPHPNAILPQYSIRAPKAGTIEKVLCQLNGSVDRNAQLVQFVEAEEGEGKEEEEDLD